MSYKRKIIFILSLFVLFLILIACLAHGGTQNNRQEFERSCYAAGGYLAQDNCVVRQINVRNRGSVQSTVCQTVCKSSTTLEIISREQ